MGKVPRHNSPYKQSFFPDVDFAQYLAKNQIDIPAAHVPAPKHMQTEILALQRMDRSILQNERAVDYSRFETATGWAKEHFSGDFRLRPSLVQSRDEAISQILSGDSKDGSPGYPHNTSFHPFVDRLTKNGKISPYLTKKDCYTCPLWLRWFSDEYYPSLFTTAPYTSIFSLSLKSQIVTKEKADENNNRIFCVATAEHFLAMVMILGKLHDTIMHGTSWCSAGHSVHYGGAHRAVAPYLKGGMWAGYDFKNYDLSLFWIYFKATFEVVTHLLNDEERLLYSLPLVNLFRGALYALVLTGFQHVYLKHTGNPSGWFLTLLMNTISLVVLIAYSWLHLPFTAEIAPHYESFVYHLAGTSVCGDDQRHRMTLVLAPLFTYPHHHAVWGPLGLTLKPGEVSDSPLGVEYCGRYLKLYYGHYVPVGRVSKYVDSCAYVTTTDPLIRLQRLVSIYMECWNSPKHAAIIWGFIKYMYAKYPSLSDDYPPSYIPSERKIRYWATGIDM